MLDLANKGFIAAIIKISKNYRKLCFKITENIITKSGEYEISIKTWKKKINQNLKGFVDSIHL
jgi:hypothetical protein